MTEKISPIQLADTLMLRVLIEALHRNGIIAGDVLYESAIDELRKIDPKPGDNADKQTIQQAVDRLVAAMLTLPD